MSYRQQPTIFRQRFAPGRQQPSFNSYDYECDENQSPTFHNGDRPEVTNGSFPPRKSFIDTIVTRNDEYWQNRVTLKLDVPFTDHSHIIGRGGKNTQAVMKQTACHIHFPDSNKNHDSDKSNQVSIAGPIGKVEIARSRIRGLAPLSISFELKGMLPSVKVDQLVADACLEKTLGFAELNIVVRTNRASGQPYCLVRGSAHQMDMMVEACEALRRLFFPPDITVSYSTSLEVLPGQQASVIGRNGRHIDWIAQKTGATVHFPSASDCQRGASTFYIAGSINSILDARKHILGLLPVQLTFEVRKGNAKPVQPDPAAVEQLLGVTLTVKYRPNGADQAAKAVTVRSSEYNLTNVYAVRGHLVESTDDIVLCADYEFMRDMRAIIEQPVEQSSIPSPADPNSCFPPPMPPMTQAHLPSPHPLLFSGFNQFLLQQNMPLHQMTTAASYMQRQMGLPTPPPSMLLSAQQQQQQFSQQSSYPVQPQLYQNGLTQPQQHQHHHHQHQHQSLPLKEWLLSDRRRADNQSTGLASSPESHSPSPPMDDQQETMMTSLKNVMLNGATKPAEPPTTPKTTSISPNPEESPLAHSVLAAAKKFNSAQNGSLWKAPGIERRPLTSDLDQLRILATQAMHQSPTRGGVRTPTEQWSGMLFSNSAPTAALKAKSMFDQAPLRARFRGSNEEESGMGDTSTVGTLPSVLEDGDGEENDSPASAFSAVPPRSTNATTAIRRPTEFAATSYWDSASLQSPYMNIDWDVRKFRDPSMVLAALGLSDHHSRFRDEEIDMEAFLSLDEENLKELGVSTIGARTKLRIAIMKLNESISMYGHQ